MPHPARLCLAEKPRHERASAAFRRAERTGLDLISGTSDAVIARALSLVISGRPRGAIGKRSSNALTGLVWPTTARDIEPSSSLLGFVPVRVLSRREEASARFLESRSAKSSRGTFPTRASDAVTYASSLSSPPGAVLRDSCELAG